MSAEASLGRMLAGIDQAPKQWTKPDQFDLSSIADRNELSRRVDTGQIKHSVDRLDEIVDDLFELRNPSLKTDVEARADFAAEMKRKGLHYGAWFHFPWSESIVRYPEQDDHQELRTFRNKNLITDDEQKRLLGATAAVFGLSVGSNVVEQLVLSGVGGTVAMGDFDVLAPSNTNRIKAAMPQVGMNKLDIAAIKTSEVDPYLRQVHLRDGITKEGLEKLADLKPDIVFDEIDDLAMKAQLRLFAQEQKVPLVMATDLGDKSLIDVERYDLNDSTRPFLGKVKEADMQRLVDGSLSDAEKSKYLIRILGVKHLTARILNSVIEIDKTLAGIPQLGTTASAGGSLAAVAAREILIGRKLDTGRYVASPRDILDLQRQTGLRDGLDTVSRFRQHMKSQKAE